MAAKVVTAIIAVGAISYMLIAWVNGCSGNQKKSVGVKYVPVRRPVVTTPRVTPLPAIGGAGGRDSNANAEDTEQIEPADPSPLMEMVGAEPGQKVEDEGKTGPSLTDDQIKMLESLELEHKKHANAYMHLHSSTKQPAHCTGYQKNFDYTELKADMREAVKATEYHGFLCE